MVYVRMLVHRTGGRFDGQEWPPYLGTIDVPDWEAQDLIRDRSAQYLDSPELDRGYDVLRVADPDFEAKLKLAEGGLIDNDQGEHGDGIPAFLDNSTIVPDYDSDFDRDDSEDEVTEDEVTVTEPVKKPYGNASKLAWVEYAVSQGADKQEAQAMTKAALILEWGN